MKFEVACCREKNADFFSSLIMKITKKNYSHAFIIVGETLVYDATEKGICATSLKDFLADHNTEIVHRVEVRPNGSRPGSPEFLKGFACGWLEASVGTADYSWAQALAIALPIFNKIFLDSKRLRICSNYVAVFMRDGLGIYHPRLGPDVRSLKPSCVLEIAQEVL